MNAQPKAALIIVDEEPAQANALCAMLAEEGYATAGFDSPIQALAALRDRRFDLLIAGLTMSQMDGTALLRAAQEIDGDLIGILVTDRAAEHAAIAAMKHGALDYILKPLTPGAIAPVVSRALEVRRLRLEIAELQRHARERSAEAEAARAELEAFSYSVSHDLRAPLRAVTGFSDALIEDFSQQIPEEARQLLNKVGAAAQRMDRLIEGLVLFSRLGQRPLSVRPVDLAALVQEVLGELRRQQGERDMDIRVGALPMAVADPVLLKQLFISLLSNAFKFTRPRSRPVIEVGGHQQPGERVYFVRDDGAGFDMRYAGKLFAVFQRLHSAEEFEGIGIGLSMAQRIVQRHGGRIWAEGEVGKGATFYFSLPD